MKRKFSKISRTVECKACGRILEAPLMTDVEACCKDTVKTLCTTHIQNVIATIHGRAASFEEMLPFIEVIDKTLFPEEDSES